MTAPDPASTLTRSDEPAEYRTATSDLLSRSHVGVPTGVASVRVAPLYTSRTWTSTGTNEPVSDSRYRAHARYRPSGE